MKKMISYGRQHIDENDIEAVVNILKSDWLTQGPTIEKFEKACAIYCNAKYGIAVNSATSALHIACLALDLKAGDIVWTSPNTFVASSNCALYCGATVDFVDIDPKTYNISVSALEEKLHWANKNNNLPKIIIPVHFAGQSCEMKEIKHLADPYGIKIIEDASHAIGGKYLGELIGSCRYSDATVFSFHPVKIITTGEGGMVLTNSQKIRDKAELLRTHGITRDPGKMERQSEGAWYYEQVDLGFNYRMTEIQASLGISQLQRIQTFINRRFEIAQNYNDALSQFPLELPWQSSLTSSSYHLYPIQIKLEELNTTRKKIFDSLRESGIGVNVHYIPVHRQPFYEKKGFRKGDFPVAENYYQKAISLPIHYSLSIEEQSYIIEILNKLLMT